MKTLVTLFSCVALLSANAATPPARESGLTPDAILALTKIPAGQYVIVTLGPGETERKLIELKLEISGDSVKAVGGESELGAVTGRVMTLGNGVFMVRLKGDGFMATQWWVFQPDGNAKIKEIPDRGEGQIARRIADTER